MDQSGLMTFQFAQTEAEQFLVRFHRDFPGCTPTAFAESRTETGESSYDLLVGVVPLGARVLDLGCGDGFLLESCVQRGHDPDHLIGVDLSADELALAAQRPLLSEVTLHHGHAHAAPVSDHSIDVVLCHMTLMLLGP